MCNFQLLLQETEAMCKTNGVDFRYTELGFTDEYQFQFTKGNKGYTLTISKVDIYFKPFEFIISEVYNAIYALLNINI
jgi:hypothetical protein